VLNISTTLPGVISHARLFVTGQLRNPCQMLAEPLDSAEPQLKITVAMGYTRKSHFRRSSFQTVLFANSIQYKVWRPWPVPSYVGDRKALYVIIKSANGAERPKKAKKEVFFGGSWPRHPKRYPDYFFTDC